MKQDNQKTQIPGHDGNDCFVYELPDGSPASKTPISQRSDLKSEFTVLKNVDQIPAQFDGYVGYRMKLFLLKNKSPPTLVVKAIERVVQVLLFIKK